MFEHDEKTIGGFIMKSGFNNEGMINTYKGCGGYGYYDKSDADGYPTDYYSMLGAESRYFHNFGSYFNISSITDGTANSLSYVNSDGEVFVLTGSGENTIAKIRYIKPSSRGYVYSCALNNQIDIRMIINGHNVKVLEGLPGMYEINGSDVSSYTYQGVFSYEDVQGKVITTYCNPIYFNTPDEFGVTSDKDVIGVQIVCDSRTFDWYWDDIKSKIITEVKNECVLVEGSSREFFVGHLISDCMQIPDKGKAVYFDSLDNAVWLGSKIYKHCSYSVYDTLWAMLLDTMCPPNRSILYPSALRHVVHMKGTETFIKPYAKSLSIFMTPEMKLFDNTEELRKFLNDRDRPYAFSSLVNTLVRRGIMVNYETLQQKLLKGGIVVHNTHLVVVSGNFPSIDFTDFCTPESVSYVKDVVRRKKDAWFKHHLVKTSGSCEFGSEKCLVRPGLPLSGIRISGDKYFSFLSNYSFNTMDLVYLNVGEKLFGRVTVSERERDKYRIHIVSQTSIPDCVGLFCPYHLDTISANDHVLFTDVFVCSVHIDINCKRFRVLSFGLSDWTRNLKVAGRYWKYVYCLEYRGNTCPDDGYI